MYIPTLVCTRPACQGYIITVVITCFLVVFILGYTLTQVLEDGRHGLHMHACMYQKAHDYHRDDAALACRACTDKGAYVHAQGPGPGCGVKFGAYAMQDMGVRRCGTTSSSASKALPALIAESPHCAHPTLS